MDIRSWIALILIVVSTLVGYIIFDFVKEGPDAIVQLLPICIAFVILLVHLHVMGPLGKKRQAHKERVEHLLGEIRDAITR